MGWDDYEKVQHEQMLRMLEGALQPRAKELPVKPGPSWACRNAILREIADYIDRKVPAEIAYTMKLAMLDYACQKIAEEPDDDEEEDDEGF